MKLQDLFPRTARLPELAARDKEAVVREMLARLVELCGLSEEEAGIIEGKVLEREMQASTGIGKGLAVPHAKNCDFLKGVHGVYARSVDGVDFNSIDGEPAQLFFLIVSSPEHADGHLQAMRKIAGLARDDKTLRYLAGNDTDEGLDAILEEIDDGDS